MKSLALIPFVILQVGLAESAPIKSKDKAAPAVEQNVYRSTAVEELSTAKAPAPLLNKKSTSNAFTKVSVDQLVMKFDDPNPPKEYARDYYLGLNLGTQRARGTVTTESGDTFDLSSYGSTSAIGLNFGGSFMEDLSPTAATESDLWTAGLESKFSFSKQSIQREGFIPAGTSLQASLAAIQPWISRRFQSFQRASVVAGLEIGYFQYSQSSSLSSFRFSRSSAVAGLELGFLYDLSKHWSAKLQANARRKLSGGDALELPESALSLGGRYQW